MLGYEDCKGMRDESYPGGGMQQSIDRRLLTTASQEGTLETLSKSKPTMEYYPEARIDWLPVLVQPKQEEGNRKEESVET